jgi:hypothetical protein
VTGDCHARICGSRGLRCPRPPDQFNRGHRLLRTAPVGGNSRLPAGAPNAVECGRLPLRAGSAHAVARRKRAHSLVRDFCPSDGVLITRPGTYRAEQRCGPGDSIDRPTPLSPGCITTVASGQGLALIGGRPAHWPDSGLAAIGHRGRR